MAAIERAHKHGHPLHEAWLDYGQFLRDVGRCPENSYLRVQRVSRGCVPGNVHWHGHLHTGAIHEGSYSACDVATTLVKEGLLTHKSAVLLAVVDADPGYVRRTIYRMRQQVQWMTVSEQAADFAALVENLAELGVVPVGEPTRWEIEHRCNEVKRENEKAERDMVPVSESAVAAVCLFRAKSRKTSAVVRK